MSIWFVIWALFSAALLYFVGWTQLIVYRQKACWRGFAAKYGLRFADKGFLQSGEMSGTYEGLTLSVFSGEHAADDFRGTRKLTAVEIKLGNVMPFEGAIASGGMVSLVRSLNMKEELRPAHEEWQAEFIAAAGNKAAMQAYLTPERLEGLLSLMVARGLWTIFIFRADTVLLRVDTPDPLHKPERLEKLLRRMVQVARTLELRPGEGERLRLMEAHRLAAPAPTLRVDEDGIAGSGLRLEDE